jgi:phosphoribosylamine--glycine ligase
MGSRNVLVIGSGGREYALCLALEKSPSVGSVLVAPGSAGMSARWPCHDIKTLDHAALLSLVDREKIELVVVGPEAPLVEGLVDTLQQHGVAAYGPTAAAARLEGSKVFMKKFAQRYCIPTAAFQVFTNPTAARAHLRKLEQVPVIKADGLCAGKGVVVAGDMETAISAVDAILERRAFGNAGAAIIIEEKLAGEEVSIQAMCDGERLLMLAPAQDHKRAGDGDTGLNTGGMGAYAPAPIFTKALEEKVRTTILEPTLRGMQEEGQPFRGTLYAGLMITPRGEPYLLEYNVRFGDPEAQVILPLIEGDFAEACYQCAKGELKPEVVRMSDKHALSVVLAAAGYPGNVRTGDRIEGLKEAEAVKSAQVLHAGTRKFEDGYVVGSGRVLNVVGIANTLQEARDRAYESCSKIRFEGMHYRKDIGARALRK